MKNYFNTFANFLKKNGIIKSRTYFSTKCKSKKEMNLLKQVLGELMSETNPKCINKHI